MIDALVQVIFGWPAIIAAILLSITGSWIKKPGFLIAAGIVCVPFTYYVSNGFRSPLVLLPVFELGAAYALTRQFNKIAWLLIAPLPIVAAFLAYTVLKQ